MLFHLGEKWHPIRSHKAVWVSRQNSNLLQVLVACRALALRVVRRHSTRKVFLEEFFCVKKWKTSLTLEWNSFVYFSVGEDNYREPAKQQRKEKSRTRIKFKLCFLSDLLCLPFKLKCTYVQIGQFTQSHSFLIVHSEQRVNITFNPWVTSYPYTPS